MKESIYQLCGRKSCDVSETSQQKTTRVLQDNRENSIQLQQQQIAQRNNTGLPDNLKAGIENLSGYSMDDVRVHYNSPKPAQLNAHAFAQGSDIHLATGQEKHLPHEVWHVVQQKQGRVKPTMQMKGKVNVNNEIGLEKEADIMGGKAMKITTQPSLYLRASLPVHATVQRIVLNTSIGPIDSNAEHKRLIAYIEHTDVNDLYELKKQLIVDEEAQLSHDEILLKRIDRRIQEIQTGGMAGNQIGWIVKLELPGSGDIFWRTNGEKIQGQIIPVNSLSIHYRRSKAETPYKTTFTIAGPQGKIGPLPSGTSDTGSNSIESNVSAACTSILSHIRDIRRANPYYDDFYILVDIKAHSRNAVAGARIAKLLMLMNSDAKLKVNYVGFDPVPGPDHSGEDVDNDIGRIDESTVIYSMQTEYTKFFTPTRMRNMKRLIISKQLHGGGIKNGYAYNGYLYKGAKINRLPPGIYFDENENDSNVVPLVKIDADHASDFFKTHLIPGWFDPQKDRKNIVKSAIDDRANQDIGEIPEGAVAISFGNEH